MDGRVDIQLEHTDEDPDNEGTQCRRAQSEDVSAANVVVVFAVVGHLDVLPEGEFEQEHDKDGHDVGEPEEQSEDLEGLEDAGVVEEARDDMAADVVDEEEEDREDGLSQVSHEDGKMREED